MKKIIFVGMIIFTVTLLFTLDPVAIALKVKGEVELTREEKLQMTKSGDELYNEDTLESKQESFAAIKFVDGNSLLKLFPNSVLKINVQEDKEKLNNKHHLKIGDIWTKVEAGTGEMQITTPTSIISVIGTEFILSVAENGETDIFTFSGEVSVKNISDGQEVYITAGQKAHSTGSDAIIVTPIQKGDLNEEQQEMMQSSMEKALEFEIENDQGDNKKVKIKFE